MQGGLVQLLSWLKTKLIPNFAATSMATTQRSLKIFLLFFNAKFFSSNMLWIASNFWTFVIRYNSSSKHMAWQRQLYLLIYFFSKGIGSRGAIGSDTDQILSLSYLYPHPTFEYGYWYWTLWENDIRIRQKSDIRASDANTSQICKNGYSNG